MGVGVSVGVIEGVGVSVGVGVEVGVGKGICVGVGVTVGVGVNVGVSVAVGTGVGDTIRWSVAVGVKEKVFGEGESCLELLCLLGGSVGVGVFGMVVAAEGGIVIEMPLGLIAIVTLRWRSEIPPMNEIEAIVNVIFRNKRFARAELETSNLS